MSEPATPPASPPDHPLCVVCRRPLVPGQGNIAFGAGGQVFFGAHAGECERLARDFIGGASRMTRVLLQSRAPRLLEGLSLAHQAFQRITGGGGQHG